MAAIQWRDDHEPEPTPGWWEKPWLILVLLALFLWFSKAPVDEALAPYPSTVERAQ